MAKTLLQRHCNRCGWSWYPNKPEPPKKCPRCQSLKWNQIKVEEK